MGNSTLFNLDQQQLLQQLTDYVIHYDIENTARLINIHPQLATQRFDFQDRSKRQFNNWSLLQYAKWVNNFALFNCLQQQSHPDTIQSQLQVLPELTHKLNLDEIFSIQPLTQAQQTYINHFNTWTNEQRQSYWIGTIGKLQFELPAHFIHMYLYDKEDDSTHSILKSNNWNGDWWSHTAYGGPLGGNDESPAGWAAIRGISISAYPDIWAGRIMRQEHGMPGNGGLSQDIERLLEVENANTKAFDQMHLEHVQTYHGL